FSDQVFPGVGGSIGLTRLYYILNEQKLLNIQTANLVEYALIPISDDEVEYAFKLADELRAKNHSATIVLTDKKLGDKLTYAAKLAKNGIVIGESEVASGKLQVKDFSTGETNDLDLNA
ncbi:MAG: His/Gly/Thr/Pro-type tRNA ligase C-terminal domain-containing protein, partial [Candidatus Saccharibacteria bacterium]|nr:His/Gly/Thr/Pro-type tRNA ligase C-terminal domain-containing protein [Candidatus Saccharibacteria bacterium]